MFVINVLTHNVGDDDAAPTVRLADTVMVPVALTVPQPPVNGII
jgi:hypothetical protein